MKDNDKPLTGEALENATGGTGYAPYKWVQEKCPGCPHTSIKPYKDSTGRMISPCYNCDKRN